MVHIECLVVVLNRKEHVKPLLKALLNIGISGATMFASSGMGRTLADEVPVFGSLRHALNGDTVDSTTVFSVIEDPALVDQAIQAVSTVVGDLGKPGTGIAFTVPVSRVAGTRKPAPRSEVKKS